MKVRVVPGTRSVPRELATIASTLAGAGLQLVDGLEVALWERLDPNPGFGRLRLSPMAWTRGRRCWLATRWWPSWASGGIVEEVDRAEVVQALGVAGGLSELVGQGRQAGANDHEGERHIGVAAQVHGGIEGRDFCWSRLLQLVDQNEDPDAEVPPRLTQDLHLGVELGLEPSPDLAALEAATFGLLVRSCGFGVVAACLR